jgi:hypothetical protein
MLGCAVDRANDGHSIPIRISPFAFVDVVPGDIIDPKANSMNKRGQHRNAQSLAIAVLCFGLILPLSGSTVSPRQAPQSASLVVRLLGGKTTFRVGEEIPLELEFRGRGDGDFYFSTENYDRSGRLRTEEYAVAPRNGFVDPLSDLFADGYIGGGIRGEQSLDGTPFVLRVSLNDWIRFTQPGAYRVVVTSGRLHRRSNQPASSLTSDPIDITITPFDDSWAASETRAAINLIDTGGTENLKHGAALLRYLDTEAAATALLDRYDVIGRTNGWDIHAALVASSRRRFLISRMEARVDTGDALDATFISTLARLRALAEIPPAPGNANVRRDRMTAVQAEYDARWRAALAKKPATAATMGAELTRLQATADPEIRQRIADDLAQHPAEAVEGFVALSSNTQWLLLNYTATWSYLNRPWILPALRRVFANWNGGSPGSSAGDLALTRLYELAPEEGRRLILEEIRTGDRQIGYDALAILPEAELSELDPVLEARYLRQRGGVSGTIAWLIARYGSSKLIPFVNRTFEQQDPGCLAEGGLIAYLLKHDPEPALKRLDANQTRPPSACSAPLRAVTAHYWDDRVEAAAIAQLDAPAADDVVDAAQILGARGSRMAKEPVLNRLIKWSAEWQGRAGELADFRRGSMSPQRIENFLVNALMQNKQFSLTSDEVSKIRSLCVTAQCQTNVDAQSPANRSRIDIR